MVEEIIGSVEGYLEEKEKELEELKRFIENVKIGGSKKVRVQDRWSHMKKYALIHFSGRRKSREVEYSEEEMERAYRLYVEYCVEVEYPVTLSGFALFAGIDRGDPSLGYVNDKIEAYYEGLQGSGKVNGNNVGLILKHRHKWKDKDDSKMSGGEMRAIMGGVIDGILGNSNKIGKVEVLSNNEEDGEE